ncbi:MAG: carboxypeptidase-like regulatory domain-containing protein, partial [Gemmatimonadota bacterium]
MALLGAGRLAAQGTTGKIEGTVRDQARAPINGARVLVVGSAFSASTNEQGYYFMNNVPAGVMAVRAQYIG